MACDFEGGNMTTRFCLLLLLLALLPSNQSAQTAKKISCDDTAKTQGELHKCASDEYAAANLRMDSTYQRILREYAADSVFVNKLQAAQQAWLKFRDAEIRALYPEEDKLANYGSAWPMCYDEELTRLTQQRTRELEQWLKGTMEGDVCAGSVRTGKVPAALHKPK
jgi:uncharacterized protein YecT (DUF1311 family)